MRTIAFALLCSVSFAGSPPILEVSSNRRDRIQTELIAQPTDTFVETVRKMQNQMQLLTDEMARLSRSQKLREECGLRMGKLENRAWQHENPGVTYPGQSVGRASSAKLHETTRTATRRIVDSYQGNYDGSRDPLGTYLITVEADGTKRRWTRRTPMVRSAAISRPVAPISYGSAYMQPANMGWGSSFFGGGMMGGMGAACAGGS